MSWFPQRWRTQRNAIRNANCRIQWIIKSLNACCASGYSWEHACLSVCSHLLSHLPFCRVDGDRLWVQSNDSSTNELFVARSEEQQWLLYNVNMVAWTLYCVCILPNVVHLQSDLLSSVDEQYQIPFRTSNQVRGPAEFKHIIKRRKRN